MENTSAVIKRAAANLDDAYRLVGNIEKNLATWARELNRLAVELGWVADAIPENDDVRRVRDRLTRIAQDLRRLT